MQLNQHIKALMDQIKAQPGPKLWEVSPKEARMFFSMAAKMMDPQSIKIADVRNLTLDLPGRSIPARLYAPDQAGDRAPLVVFYHGGGFVMGDIDSHDPLCRNLANASGCLVLSVDYRLAPEHKFPAAVEDAYDALLWAAANAADLGADPARIAIAGDSAGGNLAAVVSQLSKARSGPKIAFQLLIYPVTKAVANTGSRSEFARGYFLEQQAIDWFMGHYLGAPEEYDDPRVSPLVADDLSELPSAMVITAGFDPLKDEGKAYADRLSDAGVQVAYIDYPSMVHGFFNMTGIVPAAKEAVIAAGAAIKAHFDVEGV